MFKKYFEKSDLKKINAYRDIDGWISEQEALGLYRTARKLPTGAVVVEIGSWMGKSTYCISRGLASGKIFAIDPFNADAGNDDDSQDTYNAIGANKDLLTAFQKNLAQRGVTDKVVPKKGYSQDFHQEFNTIDFLFIDGDHSIEGCKSDFELYAHKVVKGGYIAFHDFYEDRNELGPTYVIKNMVLNNSGFQFIKLYDSLWVGKRV